MKEILADIRRRLQDGEYANEEHVRLSLVARLLQRLGWDIWNPREVNAEFVVVPREDNTKVDFALFPRAGVPAVYIEVKAVGRTANLEQTERQLRDYNRNNTALFCVITDGRMWRLYYSQTGGEFSKKCFKILDLLEGNPDDIEHSLTTFLSKQEILGSQAEEEAKSILRLTQKQRAMEDCFRKAQKQTQLPPFPNFPDALAQLVALEGFNVTRDEATSFIEKAGKRNDEEEPPAVPKRKPGEVQPPAKPYRLDDQYEYVEDEQARQRMIDLVDEIRAWNPQSIAIDPIKDAISIKVNDRVLAYVIPRRKHFRVHTFNDKGRWTGYPVDHDKGVKPIRVLVKANFERMSKQS